MLRFTRRVWQWMVACATFGGAHGLHSVPHAELVHEQRRAERRPRSRAS